MDPFFRDNVKMKQLRGFFLVAMLVFFVITNPHQTHCQPMSLPKLVGSEGPIKYFSVGGKIYPVFNPAPPQEKEPRKQEMMEEQILNEDAFKSGVKSNNLQFRNLKNRARQNPAAPTTAEYCVDRRDGSHHVPYAEVKNYYGRCQVCACVCTSQSVCSFGACRPLEDEGEGAGCAEAAEAAEAASGASGLPNRAFRVGWGANQQGQPITADEREIRSADWRGRRRRRRRRPLLANDKMGPFIVPTIKKEASSKVKKKAFKAHHHPSLFRAGGKPGNRAKEVREKEAAGNLQKHRFLSRFLLKQDQKNKRGEPTRPFPKVQKHRTGRPFRKRGRGPVPSSSAGDEWPALSFESFSMSTWEEEAGPKNEHTDDDDDDDSAYDRESFAQDKRAEDVLKKRRDRIRIRAPKKQKVVAGRSEKQPEEPSKEKGEASKKGRKWSGAKVKQPKKKKPNKFAKKGPRKKAIVEDTTKKTKRGNSDNYNEISTFPPVGKKKSKRETASDDNQARACCYTFKPFLKEWGKRHLQKI